MCGQGKECMADSCNGSGIGDDPQQNACGILYPDGLQLPVYGTAFGAFVCRRTKRRMESCCAGRISGGRHPGRRYFDRRRGAGALETPDSLAGGGSLEFRCIPGTSGVCEPAVQIREDHTIYGVGTMRCAVCSRGTSGIDFVAGCILSGSAGTGNGYRMGAAQDPGVKKICVVEERSLTRGSFLRLLVIRIV